MVEPAPNWDNNQSAGVLFQPLKGQHHAVHEGKEHWQALDPCMDWAPGLSFIACCMQTAPLGLMIQLMQAQKTVGHVAAQIRERVQLCMLQ